MVVAPSILEVDLVRRREVAEFVGVAAAVASFSALWREARSWFLLFVNDISDEGLRSRLLLGSVLVFEEELPMPRVCWVVGA